MQTYIPERSIAAILYLDPENILYFENVMKRWSIFISRFIKFTKKLIFTEILDRP